MKTVGNELASCKVFQQNVKKYRGKYRIFSIKCRINVKDFSRSLALLKYGNFKIFFRTAEQDFVRL